MMRTPLLLSAALFLPLTALAADFSPHTPYQDVRTSSRESAAINAFTNEGFVRGVAPHFFGPSRRITRGEFLKIALVSSLGNDALPSDVPKTPCVRDVSTTSWLHPIACLARKQGIIGRGALSPSKGVTYGEALKMLTSLYDYTISPTPGREWAESYYRAAADRFVDLPMPIRLDTTLTRAQAVRLAAAFWMESMGKLDEYRLAESGHFPSSTSSSSSVSSSVSSSASSVSSSAASVPPASSSSSSSPSAVYALPAVSHFLLVGHTSDALAEITLPASAEDRFVGLAQVKLFREAPALKSIQITKENGDVLATLLRRTTTDLPDYKQIYEAQVVPEQRVLLEKNTPHRLIVRAQVRSPNENGSAENVVSFRSISLTSVNAVSGESVNHPFLSPFPQHQTSMGKITAIKNAGPEAGTLVAGANTLVGAFSFEGISPFGNSIALSELIFLPVFTGNVTASRWTLSTVGGTQSMECATGFEGVSCTRIPAAIGTLGSSPLVLELRATIDISPSAGVASLSVSLPVSGSPEHGGSVRWSDGAGTYSWVEQFALPPAVRGTLWK